MIDFPIIDSHIHLLDQARFAYSWAKDAPALKRDWTVDDLANRAKPYDLEGLVFVEVDVDMPQYLDEAEWVDGLAGHDRRGRGQRRPRHGGNSSTRQVNPLRTAPGIVRAGSGYGGAPRAPA